jgi:hypothetical protein
MAIAIAMPARLAISYSLALGRPTPHRIPGGVVGDPQSRPALVNPLEAATRLLDPAAARVPSSAGGPPKVLDLHPLPPSDREDLARWPRWEPIQPGRNVGADRPARTGRAGAAAPGNGGGAHVMPS